MDNACHACGKPTGQAMGRYIARPDGARATIQISACVACQRTALGRLQQALDAAAREFALWGERDVRLIVAREGA